MTGRKDGDDMTTDGLMTAAKESLAEYRDAKMYQKVARKNGDKPGMKYWAESTKFWLDRVHAWLDMAATE